MRWSCHWPEGRNSCCLDTHKFAHDKGRRYDLHKEARGVIVESYQITPAAADRDLP
jgi:hypothetical protein